MPAMRHLLGGAARRIGRAVLAGGDEPDARRLRARFRVTDDWREAVAGRAPRLDASTTIAVRRPGSLRARDPLSTVEGWRNPRKVLAVGVLSIWIGGAAALGWWARRGPLAEIRRPETDAEPIAGEHLDAVGDGGPGANGDLDPDESPTALR
jgi:hypothetical protein